ncbi:hypothetical protein H8356DRAFT_1417821 [Neocallimastix lanati (nom. inval.)]|nr:hypothetical protein H8356DRAFT_1417821 [Neocallimastix sp. JGI-2020a]
MKSKNKLRKIFIYNDDIKQGYLQDNFAQDILASKDKTIMDNWFPEDGVILEREGKYTWPNLKKEVADYVQSSETVSAYLHNIFKLHGLPLIITTARGVQFTSKFWKKHINTPYILVGYFNMSKSQCDRKYLERKDSTRRLYLEKKKKENNNNDPSNYPIKGVLSKAELNYSINEKELLGIKAATKHKIIISSDHRNLLFATKPQLLTPWQIRCQELTWKINGKADSFSIIEIERTKGKNFDKEYYLAIATNFEIIQDLAESNRNQLQPEALTRRKKKTEEVINNKIESQLGIHRPFGNRQNDRLIYTANY